MYNVEERVANLLPNEEDSDKYPVKVNGELVKEERALVHGDRLLVGMHHYYIFVDPAIDAEAMVPWEDAMKEANADALNSVQTDSAELEKIKAEAEALRKEQEENEAKMKEQMAKIEEERKKQEEELERRRAEMAEAAEGEAKKHLEEQLAKEKAEFEAELMRQREELENQKKAFEEEQRRKMESQADEQNKLQQFQEIERQLQSVVPKIAEVNAICAELGREQYLYEPEIVTQIMQNGKRVSRVVVRLYFDKDHRQVYSVLPMSTFTDVVYQGIKDLYELLFDDDDENDPDLAAIDDGVFGIDKDQSHTLIGNFYIFLATIYNLIDIKMDKTPIMDTKGQITGYVHYGVNFKVLEAYADSEVRDLIEYETLNELSGKRLRLFVEIKRAEALPKKLCTSTYCQYDFYHTKGEKHLDEEQETLKLCEVIDEDAGDMEHIGEADGDEGNRIWRRPRIFRTIPVDKKTQEPAWNYRMQHTFEIDDDMLLKMQNESLCVSVFGIQDGLDKYFKRKEGEQAVVAANNPAPVQRAAANPFSDEANDDGTTKLLKEKD